MGREGRRQLNGFAGTRHPDGLVKREDLIVGPTLGPPPPGFGKLVDAPGAPRREVRRARVFGNLLSEDDGVLDGLSQGARLVVATTSEGVSQKAYLLFD